MDRKPLREFTHNADNFLSITDSNYKQWVFRFTFLELDKDLGTKGDITTQSVFHDRKEVKTRVLAKENGIFAGKEEIKYFLQDADPNFRPKIKGEFQVDFKLDDGQGFAKGDTLLEITADVADLLAVERIVLNLLSRMCSVATFTAQIIDIVKDQDVLIVPTRKTLWGLLDKKACLIAGAGTHRINLSDAILVKDNHLDLLDRDFEKVLQKIADSHIPARFVEIEVENVDEVIQAATAFSKFLGDKIRSIGCIMMDNMSPSDVSRALEVVKEQGLYENLLFEASGGINEETVLEYAKTGVDIISMGCLTGGVKGIDLGMEVI